IAVEIVARPTVIIGAPANNALFNFGASVAFSGFATDPVDGSLTSSLTWTSSLDGVIGNGGAFSTAALRSGTHTVTPRPTTPRDANPRRFAGAEEDRGGGDRPPPVARPRPRQQREHPAGPGRPLHRNRQRPRGRQPDGRHRLDLEPRRPPRRGRQPLPDEPEP